MEKKWTVYLIKENGVVMYAGETGRDFEDRKEEHLTKRGTNLSAIPVDVDLRTITIESVAVLDDYDSALKFEDNLMLEYNTIENGWNINRSGNRWNDEEFVKNYKKEWYENNIERITEQKKAYCQTPEYKEWNHNRQQTPEYKEWQREYDKKRGQTKERKEYDRQRSKQYRKEHMDKIREYNREYMRQWRIKNKQKREAN